MCGVRCYVVLLLLLLREKGAHRGVEQVAALEEVELEDEEVAHDFTAELLDEVASCLCGAACGVKKSAHCIFPIGQSLTTNHRSRPEKKPYER